jgi:hypothetical protein
MKCPGDSSSIAEAIVASFVEPKISRDEKHQDDVDDGCGSARHSHERFGERQEAQEDGRRVHPDGFPHGV